MRYHQSEQQKNGERITALAKLPDRYIYNINYPTTFSCIDRFENDNQVSVFVYFIAEDGSIRTEKKGNLEYILNDVIHLLRVEDDDNAHYIYIKHLERLFNSHANSNSCLLYTSDAADE